MHVAYPGRRCPLSNKISFAEISPSEFFYRNRDLAGFTNPARALYMAVRELVENSMDACELAGITPNVYVRLISEGANPDAPDPKAYRLTVRDNGPGVSPQHVPSAFGKVFYGSKYVLRQSRGMFGLGGTMAILYGQITTNRPVTVVTPLPARPWTSRPTRTAFWTAAPGAPLGHTHSLTARRQFGHRVPAPVEYTILSAMGSLCRFPPPR